MGNRSILERLGFFLFVLLSTSTSLTSLWSTVLPNVVAAADWTYSGAHGPDDWPGLCTTGKKQSPINVVTDDTIKTDIGSLKFIRYDYAFSGYITNNGHSVQISLTGIPILLEGGGLPGSFVLEQLHFHWGAEHTIDDSRDQLELHLVHYNGAYANFTEAANKEDGLAVVAVLFKMADKDNDELAVVLNATKSVSAWVGKSTAKLQTKVIPLLLLPKDHTTFYRYDGSLTTPDCRENVIWTILTEKVPISESQLKVFENIAGSNGTLEANYRPAQPLGFRKVYLHLDGYSGTSCTSSSLAIVIIVNLFSMARFVTYQ